MVKIAKSKIMKTKVVCTLGPATCSKTMISKLIEAGMDMARINSAHGDFNFYLEEINNLRAVAKHIPILIDIKGPDIRVNVSEPVSIVIDELITLTTEEKIPQKGIIKVDYKNLHKEIESDDIILIDDGLIELKVAKVRGKNIFCKAVTGGMVTNKKGVNIPFRKLNFPVLSPEDKNTILFAKKNNLDFIGVSFCTGEGDLDAIKRLLAGTRIGIIAKIENFQGIHNFDKIIKEVDGVMVARGDLGIEMPAEKVPLIQKELIAKCNQEGKPVIVATQMLESMINNKIPTRAETSDVANAIFDGTDAIMLSGETAIGKYPLEAVKTMVRIALETEKSVKHKIELGYSVKNISKSISRAVYDLSVSLPITKIVSITSTGYTAKVIARFKPNQEIIAVTDNETIWRQLNISYGVNPILIDILPEKEKISFIIKNLYKMKKITNVDMIIITSRIHELRKGVSNLIRVHYVKDLVEYYKKISRKK